MSLCVITINDLSMPNKNAERVFIATVAMRVAALLNQRGNIDGATFTVDTPYSAASASVTYTPSATNPG